MPALKHKLLHCVCQGESGSQASEVGVPSLESLAACDKQSLCSGQQMASPHLLMAKLEHMPCVLPVEEPQEA